MESRRVFSGGDFLIVDTLPEDVFVPEEFSEEHKMIFKTASDFIKKEVVPNLERIEAQEEGLIRHLFLRAGELGLNGVDVPVAYGGLDLDKISSCVVAEAVGLGASFAVSHANHTGISTMPIVLFGTESQKEHYLPKLASGEWIGAYCLTEANAGSDALNCRTRADLSEDGTHYVLNGEKMFITNSAWAESFIIYAKIGGQKFTAFIAERSYPGISFGAEENKMGIKGSSTRQVILENCKVPVENMILEPAQGHKVAFNALNLGRYKMGALVLAGCKKGIAESARYANTRVQFGKPISSFGLIKQKISEMTLQTYVAESLTYRVAGMIDDNLACLDHQSAGDGMKVAQAIGEYASECSICKVYGSECLDLCADEWVQILGGYGYCREYGAERMYRDSRINRIFEGTNEINRLLIPGNFLRKAMQGKMDLLGASQKAMEELEGFDPGSLLPDRASLARERELLKICKNVALASMALAARKFLDKLTDEQEVLAILADMIIRIFAMESGLLRAVKAQRAQPPDRAVHQTRAVKVFVNEECTRMAEATGRLLAYLNDEALTGALDAALGRMATIRPVDTITLRRLLADRVIEIEKYPFDV